MREVNLSQELAKAAGQTLSLSRILEAAAGVVRAQMRCGACSVFLLDPHDRQPRLEVSEPPASAGAPAPEAAGDLAALAIARMAPGTRAEHGRSLLAAPMVLRSQAVGAIVVESAGGHVFSADEVSVLESAAAQLVGLVVNARLLEAIERDEDPALFLPGPVHARPAPGTGEIVVQGTPVCPGVGIGAAVFRGVHDLGPAVRAVPSQGSVAERARLRDALVKTRNDIAKLQAAAAHDIDEEHALIFGSHLLLMSDPALIDRMDRAIAGGASAPVAVDAALEELKGRLGAVPDPYLQERAEDVDDMRGRLLSHLLDAGPAARHGGKVVVTRRMPPSLVVELKAERAQGIVTEIGGTTSHGALLARALGIPAVSGAADLVDEVRVGDQVVVDGTSGKVVVRPGAETLAAYQERARRAEQLRTEHARYRDRPLATADGLRVGMLANVGVASDLAIARDNGAEGVGLYRTEFPFIVREQFPTREEQEHIYRKAYDAFPEGPVNFRVLDLGGDKLLPGGSLRATRSPFHGYRGLRVLFDHPHVLRDQVQAFALAAAGRPLSILVPMVTSMEELRRVKEIIADALLALPGGARPPSLGVMIEAPGAVEIAADLAREADYLSIGTNDLVQYALVVDREDPRMSSPLDAYHPSILRMVRRTVIAAHAAGRKVTVCGEMAAHRDLAAALAALGVDALSVAPRIIPELKQAFAGLEIRPLVEAMDAVLGCSDARSLAAALGERLPPRPYGA